MYLPPPGQSRRGFLKRGIFGGALLALGGGFLAFRASKRVPLPPEGLLALDETEYAVATAIGDRMIRPWAGFPSAETVRVAFNVDRILARADAGVRAESKQLLKLFENALSGFLFGQRVDPFTQLPPEEQDRVLSEWARSRISVRRTGFQALHTIFMAAYYSSPLCWPAVGYSGPPPGFHQPDAPRWNGEGPRPDGNGVFHDE